MSRWFRDTLFLRLFLLMWVSLVVSHVAAFGIVAGLWFPGTGGPPLSIRMLPSLPPLHIGHDGPGPGGRPPGRGSGGPDGPAGPNDRGGPPRGGDDMPRIDWQAIPTAVIVLDYAVRVIVIGIAAAIGARWLARPVRRLVDASATLARRLGSDSPPPRLDEGSGTVEVREAARVFNRMASELSDQFRSRSLLTASLSHDLRTPLTRMRVRLETESEQPFVQRCIGDINEMNALLESALDVFRTTGSDEPTQNVDVFALLQSMVDDAAEQGHAVTLQGNSAVTEARPVALRRVMANLLGNAIRYGGGAVEIGVERSASTLRVTFDDRGPGIPPEALEAVFRPFFRVESSRHRGTGGTGLGLYIARDLIRRQGGELTLANRPGGGLCAEVSLPWLPPQRSGTRAV